MGVQRAADLPGSRPARDDATARVLSRAIGEELRRAREANRWSRGYFVRRLPSGIGARTLLSYEHGTRHLTVLRLVEVCQAIGIAAPPLLNRALQRAQVHLENLVLQVDVRQVVSQRDEKFLPLVMWAHNKLVRHPAGVVELAPSAVGELADVVGCSRSELADYLARFVPDEADAPGAAVSGPREAPL